MFPPPDVSRGEEVERNCPIIAENTEVRDGDRAGVPGVFPISGGAKSSRESRNANSLDAECYALPQTQPVLVLGLRHSGSGLERDTLWNGPLGSASALLLLLSFRSPIGYLVSGLTWFNPSPFYSTHFTKTVRSCCGLGRRRGVLGLCGILLSSLSFFPFHLSTPLPPSELSVPCVQHSQYNQLI